MTLANQSGSVGSYLNNDINVDILWHHDSSGANTAWFMNGTSKISGTSLPSLPGWDLEGINDFNSDGEADILWRNYATGENRVWFMNDTSISYSANLTSVGDANWHIEGTGDFNADGQTDILWRNYRTGTNTVWFMNGTSKVGGNSLATVGDVSWHIEGTGDFNADGQTDLLWRNYSTGANTVWFMNGTSKVGKSVLSTVSNTSWKPFVQASMATPKSDLQGTSFDVVQEPLVVGAQFDIDFQIQNVGNQNAGGFNVGFYLSTDSTISTSDKYLGYQYLPSLAAGATTGTLRKSFTLPGASDSFWNTLGSGTYYIGMVSDFNTVLDESNKTNNANRGEFIDYDGLQINVGSPDLVVQSQYAPSSVVAGDTISINASVINQGTGSAGSSNLKYYLSNDTTLDANDIYLGYDSIGSLAVNGSGSGSHSFTYNSAWGTGTKYILFKADADSAITESNESNNVAYRSISVANPNITITSPNGGNTLQGGQGYYIYWNDNLDENVRIDLYKGNSFVQTITTSTASDGSYYWLVPSSLGSGSDYRIQIGGTAHSAIYDYSDSYFAINQPGTIPNTYQPFNSSSVFTLNSNPGANHTIYLDFNGHTTTGTYWNTKYGVSSISTPAYDIDGNPSNFSATERENIWKIWRRVAEDFIPFNVNVTTALPPTDDLVKSGSSDTRWGIRVVIGGDSSWYGTQIGGKAQYNSFNSNQDTPAFVFSKNLAGGKEKSVAEAISHEVGHSLGLDHDGDIYGTEYYQGYGTGNTGWASIMGDSYDQNLSQWSKGEYSGANNPEDDLSIITTQNGFGYRLDDYGNQLSNATSLFFNGSTAQTYGIIERNTDVDWFTFNSSTGNISLSISPFEIGPNLDVMAKLYNSAGQLLQTFNPVEELFANITFSSNPGQYYLSIEGTGKSGSNGYSKYGSLGQYSITGTAA